MIEKTGKVYDNETSSRDINRKKQKILAFAINTKNKENKRKGNSQKRN